MDWYPQATKSQGNDSGSFVAGYAKKGVIHTTEGSSASGAISTYNQNNSWPHFTIDTFGKVYQHVALSKASRALENHSGGIETNRGGAIQVEVVGFASKPTWPAAQIAGMRSLMRWIESQTGIKPEGPVFGSGEQIGLKNPLEFSNDQWIHFNGWCGHQHVPENTHWDPGAIKLATLLPTSSEVLVRVPNAVAAKHRPGFGIEQFIVMSKDGAVYAFGGAPWIDAYNAHPELGGTIRDLIDIYWDNDGWGYTQYADDGAFYHWRAAGH